MKRVIDDTVLTDIANAIREKNGTNETYQDFEMAPAVTKIPPQKEEQEKTVEITENGTTEILPNKNTVFSKVTVDVNVPSSDDNFVGIKYLEYDNKTDSIYNLPTIADARSLEKMLTDDIAQTHEMTYAFYNTNTNANGGYFLKLKTVYLPSRLLALQSTFYNCHKLQTIIGDLTSIKSLNGAFYNCSSLTEIPYMPNLITLGNMSFRNCTGLTSITFHKALQTWHTGALTGCTNITEVNLADAWNTNVYIQHCPNITEVCLQDIVSKLADLTGQTAATLAIHADVEAKMTDEQKSTVTNKNWNLAIG